MRIFVLLPLPYSMSKQFGPLGHALPHNAELGPCGVVLVQCTDLLEQARSCVIIKVLTGQFFSRVLQPLQHLVAKSVALRFEVIELEWALLMLVDITPPLRVGCP